jgi:uncharacterized protein YndB with AHSA1/START domain
MTEQEGTGDADKIVLRRLIRWEPGDVFDAWLDAESVSRWMCPGEIVRTEASIDPRVGGAFRIDMHEAGGATFSHEGVYLELERPRRLAFTWVSAMTDHKRSRVTIDLAPRGEGTDLVLTHERLPNDESIGMHREGWTKILDRLAAAVGAGSR